ncbi:MAG: hypothetical protein CW691_05125 [Candidatus Bathyarchaeum sp.]|nr:MAG: hypothetical protein CW691_05125 [Candidatus Bathyarchaeum sp.]
MGNVYTVTGNISGGISVQRSNIIIDGNGHWLLGSNYGTGVYLEHVNDVILQNVKIEGFNSGIYLYHTNSSTVKRNIIIGTGIVVTQPSKGNQIVENTITRGGISFSFVQDSIIRGNDVCRISVLASNNITVNNNRIADDAREDVKLLYTEDVGGIDIDNTDNSNICGNIIERKIIGINIWHCANLKFSNNTLADNQVGFKLHGSSLKYNLHSIDTTNTVNGKQVYFLVNQSDIQVPTDAGWIAAVNCKRISVENWVSTPNWDAVLFINTSDSEIINSTFSGNFNAIRFDLVSNCTISGNQVRNNGYAAFYFEDTIDCTITKNNVMDNFCFFRIWHNSENNTFFHNNFIGNVTGSAAGRDDQNIWDNGLEGNYWEQYNGTDANGDNIGDTKYIIDTHTDSVDKYPLMIPVSSFNVVPEFPSWTPTILALAVITVALISYKRRLHTKIRNKKRACCKHELEKENAKNG